MLKTVPSPGCSFHLFFCSSTTCQDAEHAVAVQDGEVESFELLDIQEVARIISETDNFKDNCNLVIIDFLIRQGVVKPESPGYLKLLSGLRQIDCS